MRKPGGIDYIVKAIESMSLKQKEHIEEYDPSKGIDNARRLNGQCETASLVKLNYHFNYCYMK